MDDATVPAPVHDPAHGPAHHPDAPAGPAGTGANQGDVTSPGDATGPARGHRSELAALADVALAREAAHELRGATARIALFASVLSERCDDMATDDLTRSLRRLASEAEALGALCVDLLDRSHVERRTAVHLQVPVAEAIQIVLDAESDPDRRVEVRLAHDLTVVTDPFAFNRILSNLLRNAYRHGGPNVVIEAEMDDGVLVLSVGDDGPGVPDHLVPMLFEPSVRGTEDEGGYGLGLAIVDRLTRSLDGSVDYEPNGARGARFVVTLPSW